jgi:hypothetical protein
MNATIKTNPAHTQGHSSGSTALPAGTPAPDFALHSTPDQIVRLSEFRGRPVVLAFYPADWSPVCGDQMGLYNEMLSEFQDWARRFWAFRLTDHGATRRSAGIASCIFRCWRILSPKAKWHGFMACIARATAHLSGRCS